MGPFTKMTPSAAYRNLASIPLLALASVSLVLACSSSESGSGAQAGAPSNSAGAASLGGAGTGGAAAGAAATLGGAGGGGATSGGATGSAGSTNGGSTNGGTSGSASGGASAGTGAGGAPAGQGGSSVGGGAGAGGGSSVQGYTCNLVIGIDSTSEWYTSGFENQVPNDRWEIIYHHPAYIEDWAKASDDVYKLAPTSPCAMNADNPERVIFNMFADTSDSAINNKGAWVTALTQTVANLKAKYSRLKRVDLLTMTRAPNNTPCDSGNQSGSSVAQYVDDAVMMMVTSGPPAVVASPKFFAKDCSVFTSGGPHLTDTGKPVIAKLYGDYYSAEH